MVIIDIKYTVDDTRSVIRFSMCNKRLEFRFESRYTKGKIIPLLTYPLTYQTRSTNDYSLPHKMLSTVGLRSQDVKVDGTERKDRWLDRFKSLILLMYTRKTQVEPCIFKL